MKETYGWPQHIISYADQAVDQLKSDQYMITNDGLNALLERGRDARAKYYRHLIDVFDGDEILCLTISIVDIQDGKPFTKESVESALNEKFGIHNGTKLFHKFVNEGILTKVGYLYSVPIPSMDEV